MKTPALPLFALACTLLLSSSPVGHAQTPVPTPKTVVVKDTTVADAVTLFKADNPTAALAAIQAKVRSGPNAAHPDLQVARRLAGIAAALRSSGDHARARNAVTLSLARLAQPEGKMPTKDAAAALMLAGSLHEQNGDTAGAKLAYERAAALDATQKQAAARLALILEREKRAAAKPAANLGLQQRALSAKK
jgi:hypothetical protein